MTHKIDRPSRSKSIHDFKVRKQREDEEFAPKVEDGIDEYYDGPGVEDGPEFEGWCQRCECCREESRDQTERPKVGSSGRDNLGK